MCAVSVSDHDHPAIDDTLPLPPDELTEVDSAVLPRPRPRQRGLLRELFDAVLLFVLVYTLVNLLTARFIVEGSSMAPNFATGQYIIVNRVSYLLSSPARGDVVVFTSPEENERDLIKRVIGLPGETVVVRNGQVYINDTPLPEPYLNQQPRYNGEWVLGSDEYFVLGDNRNNSRDSHNFGPLARAHLIGQAGIVYWPPDAWGLVPHFDYTDASLTLAPTLVPTATTIPVP
jgi:signal peptidase I